MNQPLPSRMTAVEITRPGGPEVLVATTRPLPTIGEQDVLIAVAAAGVNRPDLLQRAGAYPAPKDASDLPGLEVSGTIAALGAKVRGWHVGERVCALVPGGGYASFVRVDAGSVLPVPAGMDMIEAAAIPETYFTVWHNVFERGRLSAGQTLLVHGGSSGIGTTAIQLGVAFGARVFATAGTEAKCRACRDLGADIAVNYKEQDFVTVLKDATGGVGVNVILDMVGGPYVPRNFDVAAPDGHIVQIAVQGGARAEIDVARLMVKRLVYTGSTLRPQPPADKARIARALRERVWPLLESRRVGPVIHTRLPLAEAAQAHALLERGDIVGKIVLEADG